MQIWKEFNSEGGDPRYRRHHGKRNPSVLQMCDATLMRRWEGGIARLSNFGNNCKLKAKGIVNKHFIVHYAVSYKNMASQFLNAMYT